MDAWVVVAVVVAVVVCVWGGGGGGWGSSGGFRIKQESVEESREGVIHIKSSV
jgi:hypothetical protein